MSPSQQPVGRATTDPGRQMTPSLDRELGSQNRSIRSSHASTISSNCPVSRDRKDYRICQVTPQIFGRLVASATRLNLILIRIIKEKNTSLPYSTRGGINPRTAVNGGHAREQPPIHPHQQLLNLKAITANDALIDTPIRKYNQTARTLVREVDNMTECSLQQRTRTVGTKDLN